jgi:hypothetical protein
VDYADSWKCIDVPEEEIICETTTLKVFDPEYDGSDKGVNDTEIKGHVSL